MVVLRSNRRCILVSDWIRVTRGSWAASWGQVCRRADSLVHIRWASSLCPYNTTLRCIRDYGLTTVRPNSDWRGASSLHGVLNSIESRQVLIVGHWSGLWQVALWLLLLLLHSGQLLTSYYLSLWLVVLFGGWSRRLVISLVISLVALWRNCWVICSLIHVLSMKNGVIELSGYDRGWKVSFDTILDQWQFKNLVDGWSATRCHLKTVLNQFPQTCAPVGWYWCKITSHNFHWEHVQAGRIKRRSQSCHFIKHDAHWPNIRA